MDLYFSPLACSMATRVALYEAGADARFVEVDPDLKRTLEGGHDFRAVNPLGLVPTLRTDDGVVLTENAAILQWVAERFPRANLGSNDALERARLQQWLCFIGTELHKGLFAPLLSKKAPEGAKSYALETYLRRLDYLDAHLTGREFLLDHFSVADAYLATVLNWTSVTPVDLKKWPAIAAYHQRIHARPSFARAFSEERVLYGQELSRQAARAKAAQAAQPA